MSYLSPEWLFLSWVMEDHHWYLSWLLSAYSSIFLVTWKKPRESGMSSHRKGEWYFRLYVHVFYDAVRIFSTGVCLLPTDSVHRAGRDRVIDILTFITVTLSHSRKPVIVEFENIPRYCSTGAATYTCTIDVRFSESFFEFLECLFVHKWGILLYFCLCIIEKWVLFARTFLSFSFYASHR